MTKTITKILLICLPMIVAPFSLRAELSTVSGVLQDCYGDGDLNGDGSVQTLSDLFYFENFLYKCGPPPPDSTSADLNNDCIGNVADYALLQCFYVNGPACFDSYPVPTCCRVRLIRTNAPGDINKNGEINTIDLTSLISFLYKNGPAPDPLWIADINANGSYNILDVAYLTSYLYKSGPAPKCTPH